MADLEKLKAGMLVKAQEALDCERDDEGRWKESWIAALAAVDAYLLALEWEALDERKDHIWPPPFIRLLSQTVVMLHDEANGSKPHFWKPIPNRAPNRFSKQLQRIFIVCVAYACDKMRRTQGLSDERFALVRKELLKVGIDIEASKVENMVKNVSKQPTDVRAAIAGWKRFVDEMNEPRSAIMFMQQGLLEVDGPVKRMAGRWHRC